jgi:alkylation response protein AidB-like acyl-CoA dehydrogenase
MAESEEERWLDWPALEAEETPTQATVAQLTEADGPADEAGIWPDGLWRLVVDSGATRWALPPELGGLPGERAAVLLRYARLAEGSLAAAFILTQHDAAVRRFLLATTPTAKQTAANWLARIADGEVFSTVGISQLTTSRRHGAQALLAKPTENGGYCLDGVMPWVTGAVRAAVLVTGAVTPEGNQLLIALPTDRAGVRVRSPFPLAALQASCTSEVTCDGVEVAAEEIFVGPAPDVMATPAAAGTGGLETSAVALGQARAAIVALSREGLRRDDLIEPTEALIETWSTLVANFMATAEERPDSLPAGQVRAQANALALRATQAYLAARKGSGFLRTEPAQRWARQALFFLVWSCPGPVAQAAIRDFAGLCPA